MVFFLYFDSGEPVDCEGSGDSGKKDQYGDSDECVFSGDSGIFFYILIVEMVY